MPTLQYGLLIRKTFSLDHSIYASMDDVTHNTLEQALDEAEAMRKYPEETCLAVFSIDMQTGAMTQIYDKLQLVDAVDDHIRAKLSDCERKYYDWVAAQEMQNDIKRDMEANHG